MTVIKKTRNTKCWRKWGKICALLVGMEIGATTMENSMEILQKVKNRTTVWPTCFTSCYVSEEHENTNLKNYMHSYVHCSIIFNNRAMETTWVFMDGWRCGIHTMKYYLAIKEWNPPTDGWTLGYQARWNQSNTKRQIPSDFTYMWNLKNKKH